MIQRPALPEGVELADERDADVRDVLEGGARTRPVRRHERGVVARPPLEVVLVGALHLHVHEPAARELAEGVEDHGAAVGVRDGGLRLALHDREPLVLEQHPQELPAEGLVPRHHPKHQVVYGPQLAHVPPRLRHPATASLPTTLSY